MSLPKYVSLYSSYLKVGLSRYQQPIFWSTGVFILVMGLAIGNHWLDIDNLSNNSNAKTDTSEPATSSLADEDTAFTADIDNLPSLLGDMNQAHYGKQNSRQQVDNNKIWFSAEDIVKSRLSQEKEVKANPELESDSGALPTKMDNPFLKAANDSLEYHKADGTKPFLGLDSANNTPDNPEQEQSQTSNTGLDSANSLETSTNQFRNKNKLNTLDSNVNLGISGIPAANNNNLAGQSVYPVIPMNTTSGYVDPTIANQQPPAVGLDKNVNITQPQTQPQPQPQTSLNQISPNTGINTTVTSPTASTTLPNNTYTTPVQNQTATNYSPPAGTVYYGGSYRVQQPNFGYGSYRSQQQQFNQQLPQPNQ
jgi:hypothetical protein